MADSVQEKLDARVLDATDARLVELSHRRLTRYTRRLVEAEAARRGLTIGAVDAEGFPMGGGA